MCIKPFPLSSVRSRDVTIYALVARVCASEILSLRRSASSSTSFTGIKAGDVSSSCYIHCCPSSSSFSSSSPSVCLIRSCLSPSRPVLSHPACPAGRRGNGEEKTVVVSRKRTNRLLVSGVYTTINNNKKQRLP
jgi:hypothetical protein